MLKNHFKIAYRTLRRRPGYTFINVFGLALGLASCVLIGLWVQDELAYDDFHERADGIYRVVTDREAPDAPLDRYATSSGPVAPGLLAEYPRVEQAVRIGAVGGATRIEREGRFAADHAFYVVDPAFFDVFTFPLVEGDAATALDAPFSLVITESMRERYFGTGSALGQTLTVNDSLTFTVTGVAADPPAHSHFTFDVLAPWANDAELSRNLDRGPFSFNLYTYVLLREGASAAALEEEIAGLYERKIGEAGIALGLQPLANIYLHSDRRSEIGPTGDVRYVWAFSAVALFIALLACINYMNLATARSMHRAREVGVRKAAGARRRQLAGQFLSEAMLVTSVAAVAALLLAQAVLPVFNRIAGKALGLEAVAGGWLLPGLAGLLLLVGFLAGSYPALALSRFEAVEVLRGAFARGGRGARLRKGLVVFQFALSAALIAGTLVVVQQLRYMRGQDLGFDKEQVLVVDASGVPGGAVVRQAETFKRELAQHSSIESSTAASSVPGRRTWKQMTTREGFAEGDTRQLDVLTTDLDFVETLGVDLVAGRDFAEGFATDLEQATILNEAAVEHLGWTSAEEALGKRVFVGGLSGQGAGTVVGVMADVHYRSLHERVEPLAVLARPRSYDYVALRMGADDVPNVLAHAETTWGRVFPGYAFDAFFLDEDFERQYRSEQRLADVLALFGGLAILIACLGLFGLAAFAAEQRTKEVGIRKALGASVTSVVVLLSRDFVRLVLVAVVLATPVAYLLMRRWLDGFAYRIDLSPSVFLLAGALALLVALLTVSYQAIRAATTDPVKSLRYE